MKRLEQVERYVGSLLERATPATRAHFTVHLHGVAQAAALLALRRGLDPVPCAVAGLLHDLSAVELGVYDAHDRLGAAMAREALTGLGSFSPEEVDRVAVAILRHDALDAVHGPYDEILKDADVLQPYLRRPVLPKDHPGRMARLRRLLPELGVPFDGEPLQKEGILEP